MVEFYNEDLELPPVEMIDAELKKIKCGCKQDSNYFVFGQGFFCTQCFAKLKGVEFVQLLELANVFEKSAYAYRDNKKSATSDFNQLADRITKKHEALRKRRDQLKTDMATQKNYTINRVDNMIEHCLNENLNHALEDLYEPSLTMSSNMSNVDLLSRNLDNLKVQDRKGEVVYSFQQRDATEVNKQVATQLDGILKGQQALLHDSNKVLDEFHKKMAQLKK